MKLESRRVPVKPERVSRNGRRFFSEAHKRAVVEKCLVPGASVSAVALAHGFNTNLVRKWISNYPSRRILGQPAGTLVPVGVLEAPAKPMRRSRRAAGKRAAEAASGWIELEIGAVRVIVRGKVDAAQLRGVFDALGVWR
jgi:transposase